MGEPLKLDAPREPNPNAKLVLDEANEAIQGARASDYGGVRENFSRIAQMWSAISPRPDQNGQINFNPEDVANFMICVKLSRLRESPMHNDSLVDIAGYAALAAECEPLG